MEEMLKSKITLFFILFAILMGLIDQPGWIKPIIGFTLLIFIFILLISHAWGSSIIWKAVFTLIILIAIPLKCSDSKIRNTGEAQFEYETADDWDKDASISSISDKVYNYCHDYPELKKLKIIIIDDCKDYKGSIRKDTTTINLDLKDIKEYRTYKDELSFKKNCSDWNYKIFNWELNSCDSK